jgi:hypothetical protein
MGSGAISLDMKTFLPQIPEDILSKLLEGAPLPVISDLGVSCVMVSDVPARRNMARASINRFLTQRYPRKELIVINGTGKPFLDSPHPLVREIMIQGPRTIGHMRNLGIEASIYPWVAIWDDDDYRDPGTLAYQMSYAEEPIAAIMLANVVKLQVEDVKEGESFLPTAFTSHKTFGQPCSLIFKKNSETRYDELEHTNLDQRVIDRCQGRMSVIKNEELPFSMYVVAVYHGANRESIEYFMEGRQEEKTIWLPEDSLPTFRTVLKSLGYAV